MRHLGIGATFWFPREAFLLEFPGSHHPFANGLRRFGALFAAEFLIFDRGRLDVIAIRSSSGPEIRLMQLTLQAPLSGSLMRFRESSSMSWRKRLELVLPGGPNIRFNTDALRAAGKARRSQGAG